MGCKRARRKTEASQTKVTGRRAAHRFPKGAVLVLALFTTFVFLGCAPKDQESSLPSPETKGHLFRLAEEFPAARQREVTKSIQLGTAHARKLMVSGWSAARRLASGTEVSFALAGHAELAFFVAHRQPMTVTLRCQAAAGLRSQRITLFANEQRIAESRLPLRPKPIKITLDPKDLHLGENRLRLELSSSRGDNGSPLPPSGLKLSAACESVEFSPTVSPSQERARTFESPTGLFLPPGRLLEYHLPQEGGQLRWNSLATTGRWEGPELIVLWQQDGTPPQVVGRVKPHRGAASLELPTGDGSEVRLTILAASGAQSQNEAETANVGLLMEDPVWLAPEQLVAGQAAAKPGARRPATSLPSTGRPNILLYLVDTLRADHLEAYGYDRPTSPHLSRFAEQALLFENAQAQSSWTRASMASIMTGLWPQVHGTQDDPDGLSPGISTLAERLLAGGYETRAFVGNLNAGPNFGFDRGFLSMELLSKHTSHEINDSVIPWLEAWASGRSEGSSSESGPLFLYVHTADPHAPYAPEPEIRERFLRNPERDRSRAAVETLAPFHQRKVEIDQPLIDYVTDLYDAEIASNDIAFGNLLAKLDELGMTENTVILFTSDHGEELYDHGGWSHGRTLYQEQLDIPLVLRLPASFEQLGGSRRIRHIAQHVDIFATFLEVAGLSPDPATQGTSLLAFANSDDPVHWDDSAVSHLQLRGRGGTSYLNNAFKLIEGASEGEIHFPLLFDRREDRLEEVNLGPTLSVRAGSLASEWRRKLLGIGVSHSPTEVDLDREGIRQELEALGYLQ